MNDSESFRRPVQVSFSNRILYHPSLQSLYSAANNYSRHSYEPDQLISREEIFYIDPTMHWGERIPNIACKFENKYYFRLNTPPPIMSTCTLTSVHRDLLRSELQPVGDLPQSEWTLNSVHSAVQPNGSVFLQSLNQQKLQTSSDGGADVPSSQPEGRLWSEDELKAADTLLSCFTLTEERALTLPDDPMPLQPNEHAFHTGLLKCVVSREIGNPGVTGCRTEDDCDASTGTERMLSDSERNAVAVLLSIWEVACLEGHSDPGKFGTNSM